MKWSEVILIALKGGGTDAVEENLRSCYTIFPMVEKLETVGAQRIRLLLERRWFMTSLHNIVRYFRGRKTEDSINLVILENNNQQGHRIELTNLVVGLPLEEGEYTKRYNYKIRFGFWNIQVIGLSETWLIQLKIEDKTYLERTFLVLESKGQRNSKFGRPFGGLLLLINKNLGKLRFWIADNNYVLAELELCQHLSSRWRETRIGIILIYLPPNSDKKRTLVEIQNKIIQRTNITDLWIIGGDANSRIGEAMDTKNKNNNGIIDNIRMSKDKVSNLGGKSLLEFVQDNNLYMLNGRLPSDCPAEYTYLSSLGKSVIDYIICSETALNMIKEFRVLNIDMSDHFPVQLEFNGAPYENREEQTQKNNRTYRRETKRSFNLKKFKNEFNNQLLMIQYKERIHLLANLYNNFYNTGTIPRDWNKIIFQMIFKKGERSCPANYRPIALLSGFRKLFTAVLTEKFNEWTENNKLLNYTQFAFTKNGGTQVALFSLTTLIQLQLYKKRQKVFALFLDIEKAYDSVVIAVLLEKLSKNGADTRMIRIIDQLFGHYEVIIKQFDKKWPELQVDRGLLQGDPWSPHLFNYFLADINECFEKEDDGFYIDGQVIHSIAYADDIVLVAPTAAGLRRKIRNIQKYFHILKLSINPRKSSVMIFRNGSKLAKKAHHSR
ncbi:uncharacterized protein [Centruroides vittatus]|uniref:uncharacterized protein n=1 Tax=Centruroides vittatus TaxID=120091 RepID=UPI00350E99E2